ncbi:LamG-like jellyroll fold domain-containing protein [Kocuria sp.]|uniref:LamG-like jellyroll fold domain-containing protein n=1 Tax=Kocuria sp. TaxID=1871328 RepID=UPI0026E03D56|nr:LamG-like jellyroll fold domain-containing protein [Kocuria sp.]MDO5618016.1 LamG-like jellyroll fold domain-containing protein [Kocuria sp.]
MGYALQTANTFTPTLPVLPHQLRTNPRHRWMANAGVALHPTLAGNVETWTDTIGGLALSKLDGSAPSQTATDGRMSIRSAGRAASALGTTLALSRPHTIAAAFRLNAFATTEAQRATILGGRDTWIAVDASGNLTVNTGTLVGFGSISVGWHVLVATFGDTTTTLRLDGTETTKTTGTNPRTTLSLAGVGTNGGDYPMTGAYTEIAAWDRALSATERAQVETDLRAGWNL